MIFLDANYFLRYLTDPVTPQDATMHEIAAALFDAVGHGELDVTTSEAALAEVAFVLAAKRQYGATPADIAAYLAPLLAMPHLHLPPGSKHRYLRALELWSEHPRLGFVDALTAATVEESPIQLATFDADFDGLPGITRYAPPERAAG